MRKLKLFFACLLMTVLSIGQVWGTEVTVSWTATSGALGSTISSVGGTANGNIATTYGTEISYSWNYTRTLVVLKSGKNDYVSMSGSYMQLGSSNAGESVEFRTSNIPGTIKSVTVLLGSKDSRHTGSITVGGTNYNAGDIPAWANSAGDEWEGTGTSSGEIVISIDCNEKKSPIYIASITVVYEEGGSSTPTCATPTFSPAAGAVLSGTEVSISCATEGATIHYTTDGSDPTGTSATTQPISITSATTIKAIAVKEGSNNSAIATAAYTVVTPLTSMQAIFDAATSTSTPTYITFSDSWVVTAVSTNGKNVYITDGEKGMILFNNSGSMGLVVGNTLSGTVQRSLKLYNGAAELEGFTTEGLTKGTADLPAVQELDAAGIEALNGANTGSLIKISGACTSESSKYYVAGVQLYNSLFAYTNPTAGNNYNVTGVYVQYNSTKEVLPRSAADIEEVVTKYTVTYDASPANGSLAIYDGSNLIASGSKVNENTVLTIETTPAEGYTLDGVTVNGSAYTESTLTLTENVTIAATFKVNTAPLVTSYVLSEIGVETSHLNGEHVGDKVNLPLTAASCSKVFRGWDADENCTSAPTYAPGAEITLAANNKFYAVYADANVVTPTDHALGSGTFNGTNEGGNTASEGYEFSKSTKGDNKAGYIQDSGTKDATIVFLQIKAESQIINEEPSAIIVTAHLGAGSDKDPLDYPVYAVLVDADDNNVGDPVVLTTAIPKAGDDFSVELPTANYADVRGVKISHMKEDGWNVRYYSMSFKYQTGGTTYDNYSTDCQAAVATPTFSPAAGTYTAVQNVTISSETTGATIYYTTNGDDPTTSSTLYNGAVEVGESMTLKAIAVKSGMADSEIASAAYTINLPLSTMDQIFAAATAAGGTATDVNIQFNNWVVSGVSTNGKNVFVTDGTKGFIIFDNGASMGFNVGDVLSGTVACKVQLYNGAAELTTLSSTTGGLNVATGGTVTPEVKAISALSGINTGAAVTINSVQFDGEYLSDGANEIKPYNSLFAYEALENGKYYNVTGIYQQFGNTTKEILPRSAADIEEVSLSDPEISYTPASATIELGQSLPGTVFANPHDLAISYNSNNEAVATVSNTGVIALGTATGTAVITASFAGDATYAAGNATYTITVNPASVSENVVILAVYDTKYYAMSTNNASSAFTAIEVEYDGSQVTVNSAEDKAAIQWTRKTSGDNTTFQTKDETPMYMKGTSGGAAMSLDANVCNWSWDGTNEYYYIGSRSFFFQNGTGFKNYATSNIKKSGYSDKAQVIAINPANIVITSKVSAELAYDPESDEITQGDSWSAPSLVNPHSVTITSYASDNESVATVEGGVIALAGGIGTANITAHFAGDASYLEGDAVYTITVNAPAPVPTGTTYTKVTSTGDITDGEYLIVYETTSVAFNGALETLDAEGNSVAVTINEGVIAGTTAIDAAVFTIDVTAGTLQSASGKYIGVSSNSNGLKQTEDASTYTHTFSIDGDGNAVIFANFESSTMKLRYNPSTSAGNLRFRYYKNDGQQAIQLYKKDTPEPPTPTYETVRSGLEAGRHYTVCLENNVTAVKGATFWSLTYRNEGGTAAYLVEETAPFAAGKPYIFQATGDNDGKLEVVYGEESAAAGTNGALVGTFDYLSASDLNTINETDENEVYMLFENALHPIGTNNHLDAHRAYVLYNLLTEGTPLPAPGKRVKSMPMQPKVATGMEALNASEKPVKLMIDGNIFILRGEKLYDATGRLVK